MFFMLCLRKCEIMNYRKATIEDVDLLVKLRLDYLIADKGNLTEDEKTDIIKQLYEYLPRHINKDLFVLLVEENGLCIATAFLLIIEKPANPSFITGKTALFLNVLTYPECRNRGVATKILKTLIEEAKQMNVSYIELSATEDGKNIYEKLGFVSKQSTKYCEMILELIN